MYPVDSKFHQLATSGSPTTRCRIYFIDDSVDCTDDNDVQTNGTLLVRDVGDTDSNKRISGDVGVVFSDLFNTDKNIVAGATVSKPIQIALLNLDGGLNNFTFGRCKVYVDVYDAATSTWIDCPMGVYIIDQPTKLRTKIVNASGYDQMQLLNEIADSWWNAIDWTNGVTISDLITGIATQCGVSVSSALAGHILNGSNSYTEAPFTANKTTYRDILSRLGEATGTIGYFDRDGALDMRWFEYVVNGTPTTYTGNPASFVGDGSGVVTSLSVPVSPTQNLNGYSKPWAGGAGDNVFEPLSGTMNGITFTPQSDGTVKISGEGQATTWTYVQKYVDLPYCGINAGDTIVIWSDTYVLVYGYNGSTNLGNKASMNGNAATYTIPSNATRLRLIQYAKSTTVAAGSSVDAVGKYYVAKGNSFSSWTPYANICPITGQTGLSVYVSHTTSIADATEYAVDWTNEAGTVYSGTINVATGSLKARPQYASYNGETLVGPWLSSMDEYVAGATPTTGAQVVDLGGAETSYTIAPQDISTLIGQNYVWASNSATVSISLTPRYSINADAAGSGIMSIDKAEYSVDAIDMLEILPLDPSLNVSEGSGDNVYQIAGNPFLVGADTSAVEALASPIYNRLKSVTAYEPLTMRMIADWSLEAGDVVIVTIDNKNVILPIMQQTYSWRGGYVMSDLISSGDPTRPVMDYQQRETYRNDVQMHEFENSINLLRSQIQDMSGNYSLIQQTINAIEQTVSSQGTTIQSILDPTGQIWTAITTNSSGLSDLEDALNGEISTRQSYIRFIPTEPAIVLGVDTGNEIKLKLVNNIIYFFNGADDSTDLSLAYAYFNSQEAGADRFVATESVQTGSWIWKQLANGDLILDFVG